MNTLTLILAATVAIFVKMNWNISEDVKISGREEDKKVTISRKCAETTGVSNDDLRAIAELDFTNPTQERKCFARCFLMGIGEWLMGSGKIVSKLEQQ